ncbi:hypothetical protein [Novosphingobium nitrogenifigens]|uniref:hypothetical protein n=1 Tax=Novosphingobium nitrogenifigens TaxID=378548 RepID=UPI0014613E5D|nr:hypothetical protein [Novosphingobium nitrogenifigens]
MTASSPDSPPPEQSLEQYVQELAERDDPYPSHFINSLNEPGPALYVLLRAEKAQLSNPAPALISFGKVIEVENQHACVNPDDIIDLIETRYADNDPEAIVEQFNDAMSSDEDDY